MNKQTQSVLSCSQLQTKTFKISWSHRVGRAVIAALVLIIIGAAGSAFAAVNPVFRNLTDQTYSGSCCVSFGAVVTINETATLKPVIVTWSSGYTLGVADNYFASVSVNGGPCQIAGYGASSIPDVPIIAGSDYLSLTLAWVVLPSDGVLVPGKNTFVLCGGGASGGDSITIHHDTLTVQLGK